MDNQQPSIKENIFFKKPKEGYGFIYKYTSPNGHSYIGQTVNTLKERAKNIISGTGYKKCPLFWKAIEKYGWKNFKIEILEEVRIEELNEIEQFFILKFNTLAPNGYNLTVGGEGGKKKEVYVYSAQNGELLEHYNSLSEASLDTGVPIETISTIMSINSKKERRQSHNLIFSDKFFPKYDLSQLNRKNYHKVYVYDRNGEYLKSFDTVSGASKELKIGQSSIRKCLSGYSLHASYYQFKNDKVDRIEPIPKNSKSPLSVCQIDPETNKVIAVFPSCAAAGRAMGLTSGNGIRSVATRGKGKSGGFFWKFDEGSTTKCLQNPSKPVRDSKELDEDIV